jgi:hypothetical protein
MTWMNQPHAPAAAPGRLIGLGGCRAIGKSGRTMRLMPILAAAWLAAAASARADEQLVEEFDGHNSLTTSDFQVPNGWEIRWHSEQVLSIGVIELDNTVIAGATGHDMGSLFVPQGGHFRIAVLGADPIPWDVKVYALGPVTPPSTNNVGEITYYQPTPGPDYKPPPPLPVVAPQPPAPVVPVVVAPPTPPTQLSADQRLAIVTVKGDRAQGLGFFLKTGTGTVVITTLGLLANNPNLEIDTAAGNKVTVTQIQAATDRDIAMISVKDFGYPGLDPADLATVQPGDNALTDGAGGVPLPPGPVTAIAPQRIDFRHFHPAPGAPVVLAATGKVMGVGGSVVPTISTDNFDDENFANRMDEWGRDAHTLVLRIDNVPGWENCDWVFLDHFHQGTCALDSYLNGGRERGSPLWKSDAKIKSANESFLQGAAGGDREQRASALQALLFELSVVADTDMDQIAVPVNFYAYEEKRALAEIAYRQALKAQLDKYRDNVVKFNAVVSRNN